MRWRHASTRRVRRSRATSPRCCRISRTKGVWPMPTVDSPTVDPPLALLAELTHRCPLACPYCSNPLELERASSELGGEEWQRVLREAAALGVLQVHFSGGEPMVRRELAALIAEASRHGLYGNLITSGTLGGEREIEAFARAGLKHVQLSFQDIEPAGGDRIAGLKGAHARKTD